MNVTVHSNIERPFVIEETDSILKKIKIRNDQSFLFYVFTGSIDNYLGSLYNYLKNKRFDNVVLVFPYEAPDYFRLVKYLQQLVQQVFNSKFAFIDYGADFGLQNHFTFNNFIDENHSTWNPSAAELRTYKWVCANRILKPHRIRLISKLLKINQTDNLLTAGNYKVNQNFQRLIDFPIPLTAPDEPLYIENNFESTRFVPNSFRNSIFNIITESSFENTGDIFETWSRIMITEKTTKAYRLHQFPIFLAPAGHVKLQRQLGFDVFDDIIDHSYDECIDSYKRIEMVFSECEKINLHSINFWQSKIQQFWPRLQKNSLNCELARIQIENRSINKFETWFNN